MAQILNKTPKTSKESEIKRITQQIDRNLF